MIHSNIIQGSEEWFALKLGKVSASHIHEVMAKLKSGEAAGRRNYRVKLVAEILTGQREENAFLSADMANGMEREDRARMAYEFQENVNVVQVGFIDHPTIKGAGSSPDGLVSEDGHTEIKCPKTATHLDYMLLGKIPDKYIKQMQFQMACSGRQWCDFVSYDPKLPVNLQLFIVRIERDKEMIAEIEEEVRLFIDELNDIVHALQLRGKV
jgi:putative phage-type endonuclease